MRKSFKVYFILALCLMLLASLSSCKSDEQKAMEKQIKTANKLLSSKSKIFDESTRSNLKKLLRIVKTLPTISHIRNQQTN